MDKIHLDFLNTMKTSASGLLASHGVIYLF